MRRRQTSPNPITRVLVVDDDVTIRSLLSDFLDDQGFQTRAVPDGHSALIILNVVLFDVILIDFQMPGLNGIETAIEIRKKEPAIPIALITGLAYTLDAETVKQAGIDRIFAKPLDPFQLIDWIRSLSR